MEVKVCRGTRPEVRVKKGRTVKIAEEASGQGCGRSSGRAGTTPSADDPAPRTLLLVSERRHAVSGRWGSLLSYLSGFKRFSPLVAGVHGLVFQSGERKRGFKLALSS